MEQQVAGRREPNGLRFRRDATKGPSAGYAASPTASATTSSSASSSTPKRPRCCSATGSAQCRQRPAAGFRPDSRLTSLAVRFSAGQGRGPKGWSVDLRQTTTARPHSGRQTQAEKQEPLVIGLRTPAERPVRTTTTPPHHATNTTGSASSCATPPAPASPRRTGTATPTSPNTSSDELPGSAITIRHARPNSPRCWPTLSRHRKLTRCGTFTGSRRGRVESTEAWPQQDLRPSC